MLKAVVTSGFPLLTFRYLFHASADLPRAVCASLEIEVGCPVLGSVSIPVLASRYSLSASFRRACVSLGFFASLVFAESTWSWIAAVDDPVLLLLLIPSASKMPPGPPPTPIPKPRKPTRNSSASIANDTWTSRLRLPRRSKSTSLEPSLRASLEALAQPGLRQYWRARPGFPSIAPGLARARRAGGAGLPRSASSRDRSPAG